MVCAGRVIQWLCGSNQQPRSRFAELFLVSVRGLRGRDRPRSSVESPHRQSASAAIQSEYAVVSGRNGTAECSVNIRVEARPNRPPTITCSASRGTVTAGESVEIVAIASDPDNDPLTYSWAERRQDRSIRIFRRISDGLSVSPASYTIAGHVDGGTGTADCSANVTVQAAPAPERMKVLETRLALHSIYFQTGQPAARTQDGGVLQSQQGSLLALAKDSMNISS